MNKNSKLHLIEGDLDVVRGYPDVGGDGRGDPGDRRCARPREHAARGHHTAGPYHRDARPHGLGAPQLPGQRGERQGAHLGGLGPEGPDHPGLGRLRRVGAPPAGHGRLGAGRGVGFAGGPGRDGSGAGRRAGGGHALGAARQQGHARVLAKEVPVLCEHRDDDPHGQRREHVSVGQAASAGGDEGAPAHQHGGDAGKERRQMPEMGNERDRRGGQQPADLVRAQAHGAALRSPAGRP